MRFGYFTESPHRSALVGALVSQGAVRNEKAAQCAALKVVGPHGLEPWTKDYELR